MVLNLHFVPETVGDTAGPPDGDDGGLLAGGEAEANPLLYHSQPDEVVLSVEAAVVQQ